MMTVEEADLLCTILSFIFAFSMLGTFTGAIFLETKRRPLAIIAGICAGCLLGILVLALTSPYLFPV